MREAPGGARAVDAALGGDDGADVAAATVSGGGYWRAFRFVERPTERWAAVSTRV